MTISELLIWLTDPIRMGSPAAISGADRLHGLLLSVAAGVLMPLAILIARYFKILPGQDWPRQLNRRFWWFGHLALVYVAALAIAVGFALIVLSMDQSDHLEHLHSWLGWSTATLMVVLMINGWQRGSTGGPGKPAPSTLGPLHGVAGDHYDMTTRRRWFERTHKLLGYFLMAGLVAGIISGLWHVNAPRWTLVLLAAWWVLLLLLALRWEHQGRCVDGYQATWGPGMEHPGNRIPELGWGSRRYTEEEFQRLSWVRRQGGQGKSGRTV